MNKSHQAKAMAYLSLKQKVLDPYAFVSKRTDRLSWLAEKSTQGYLDKKSLINWYSRFRGISDETMKLIVFEGIMESQFSKISFIINISQRSEFASKPSIEVYKFIYELVDNTPSTLKNWIEEKDFSMSRDVLALLSRSTR